MKCSDPDQATQELIAQLVAEDKKNQDISEEGEEEGHKPIEIKVTTENRVIDKCKSAFLTNFFSQLVNKA